MLTNLTNLIKTSQCNSCSDVRTCSTFQNAEYLPITCTSHTLHTALTSALTQLNKEE